MTTDTRPAGPPPIDLVRLDDKQLKKRIELNRDARFGLESATPDQLNVVFILCRRWQLDPVTDITLYQGHPWVTLEGWCRVIRRNPEWTTLRQYPVKKEDKSEWGYDEDDIVIATDLGTKSHGVITGYGKVTRAEVDEARAAAQRSGKRAAPVGLHPVEMATKRSLARTAKIALGLDIPDEVVIEQEITEEIAQRRDPERIKQNADTYDRIFGKDDEPSPGEYRRLKAAAAQPAPVRPPIEEVDEDEPVEEEVDEANEEEVAHEVALSQAWQHNRALSAMAADLKLKAKTLPNRARLEEITEANEQLEQAIIERRGSAA